MLTISLLTGMKNSCKRGYIIFDRIDIQVEVESVPFAIRERVLKARQIQMERYRSLSMGERAQADESPSGTGGRGSRIHCNAQMTTSLLQKYVQLDDAALKLLRTAMQKFNLSARAYDRILKVSRTIADLEAAEQVQSHHIAEAIGYRNLDRDNWFE